MDNQHRELSEAEIELINKIKSLGVQISDVIRKVSAESDDKRWIGIAQTDFQTGLMALTRAVAKPTFF